MWGKESVYDAGYAVERKRLKGSWNGKESCARRRKDLRMMVRNGLPSVKKSELKTETGEVIGEKTRGEGGSPLAMKMGFRPVEAHLPRIRGV